jgi:hypothetical protein
MISTEMLFLEEMDANNFEEYLEKYSGISIGQSYFIAVCGLNYLAFL